MESHVSRWVDLRSDTVTRPTPAMRDAMAHAEVGDDVFGEDPTVNRLQETAAKMLGKEAALFVPSGTMANLLAVLTQTRPGDTVILHRDSHPYNYESGNVAMVGGVLTRTLGGEQGILEPEEVAANIVRGDDHHFSPTTLIAVENTTNRGGGAAYSRTTLAGLDALARATGLKVHCDGARLFNACAASGMTPEEVARHCDTVSFCFSKGLGAPAGSILAGDAVTIHQAHRYRKMLGGGMRQAGILAAAAHYALEHHVERLQQDHARAGQFRRALEEAGFTFPFPTPTNIVYIDVPDAAGFAERLVNWGIRALVTGSRRLRVVFHLEIDDDDLERAIAAFRRVRDEVQWPECS